MAAKREKHEKRAQGENRYTRIIEKIFFAHHERGRKGFWFERAEIERAAQLRYKRIHGERHYRLVPPEEVDPADIASYRDRAS